MVKIIDETEASEIKRPEDMENPKHLYVRSEWVQFYYQCASNFLSHTMPRLLRLGKPEDVRIVFWFDN